MNAVRNQKKVLVTTPTVDAKNCTHCHQHKPTADFYRQNTSHDGLRSWCKASLFSFSMLKLDSRARCVAERCQRLKLTDRGSR